MPVAEISPEFELYYEETGSGEPLLLIMGFGVDSRMWMFQVPDFARHYRTIIFDNRGTGRSSKPAGPYTIKQMADDTRALMNSLNLDSAHIVGISMGGMIAQELAINYPELTRTLTLACTYMRPDPTVKGHMESIVASLGGKIASDGSVAIDPAKVDPMAIVQSMIPLILSQSFLETNANMVMEVLAGSLQFGFSIEAIAAQAGAVGLHNTEGRLERIKCPTLVITGTADILIPPANSDALAKHIPGAKLVKVEGGTHGFNFEMPQRFNTEVLNFLAEAESTLKTAQG